MKTMLDLLTRLVEMRNCCERAKHNSQLTQSERATASCFKSLVRDCLPPSVLATYDEMKDTDPELLDCPEVFAMAVLVSTYQRLPAVSRRRLVSHFAIRPSPENKIPYCRGRHSPRAIGPRSRNAVSSK